MRACAVACHYKSQVSQAASTGHVPVSVNRHGYFRRVCLSKCSRLHFSGQRVYLCIAAVCVPVLLTALRYGTHFHGSTRADPPPGQAALLPPGTRHPHVSARCSGLCVPPSNTALRASDLTQLRALSAPHGESHTLSGLRCPEMYLR